MYCRHCSYELRELPRGRCPECGQEFDPGDPASYAAAAHRVSPGMKRGLLRAAAVVVAVGMLLVLLPNPYEQIRQIDSNSGRERVAHRIFGLSRSVPRSTFFGDFSQEHLTPLGPPMWRATHYWSPFDPKRVSYRYGRIRHRLQQVEFAFAVAELHDAPVPLEIQITVARAALSELAAERVISIDLHDNGGFDVYDQDGQLIAGYKPGRD